jgi:hypothetical protein
MKASGWMLVAVILMASALVQRAEAQIVYTQVNVSIPVNSSYSLDLNGDGVVDFTLRSKLIQGYCQSGDEYVWSLSVDPAGGNDVVIAGDQAGSDYASALAYGVLVNNSQTFYPNESVLAELTWGSCGIATTGQWLNSPTRYLGLQFVAADGTHYAWAKLSTVAYVDQDGHLHATTLLSGFAYQSTAGAGILTGATQ